MVLLDRVGVERHPQSQSDDAVVIPHGDDVVLAPVSIGEALRDARHDAHGLCACGGEVGQVEALPISNEVDAVVEVDEVSGQGSTGWCV